MAEKKDYLTHKDTSLAIKGQPCFRCGKIEATNLWSLALGKVVCIDCLLELEKDVK